MESFGITVILLSYRLLNDVLLASHPFTNDMLLASRTLLRWSHPSITLLLTSGGMSVRGSDNYPNQSLIQPLTYRSR